MLLTRSINFKLFLIEPLDANIDAFQFELGNYLFSTKEFRMKTKFTAKKND